MTAIDGITYMGSPDRDISVPVCEGGLVNTPWNGFVFVSNALPEPSRGGGLVVVGESALLRSQGSRPSPLWIGRRKEKSGPLEFHKPYEGFSVDLPVEVFDRHYLNFANGVLWPAFHNLPNMIDVELINANNIDAHREAVHKFAETTYEQTTDRTWVSWQDYHLLGAKRAFDRIAREHGSRRMYDPHSFFLHIPFPSNHTLDALPQYITTYILRSLLAYDLVGLQTSNRDVNAMLSALYNRSAYLGVHSISGPDSDGLAVVRHNDGETRIAAFPASINPQQYKDAASQKEIDNKIETLRSKYFGREVIFNIGRTDYTKGYDFELEAFDRLLEEHPELLEGENRPLLVQVISPSRVGVKHEDEYLRKVKAQAQTINAKWVARGYEPVLEQITEYLPEEDKLAFMRIASVISSPAVADGCNLVVKEGVTVNSVDTWASSDIPKAAIVLGIGAGASEELASDVLLVDPTDPRQFSRTLYRALLMSPREREARLNALSAIIDGHTSDDWARGQEGVMRRIYEERFGKAA